MDTIRGSFNYEGPIEFWDNETFDGGRFFVLGNLDGEELDQAIADSLGIHDRERISVKVTVEATNGH